MLIMQYVGLILVNVYDVTDPADEQQQQQQLSTTIQQLSNNSRAQQQFLDQKAQTKRKTTPRDKSTLRCFF